MQAKVSMVVPCYNKEDYIGEMLESVYNQVWDNIELILVNDGSTDGTRDIISQWEPRFLERGFEVVVIDEENQGLPAAVRNGMLRITGEYACQVDCDDIIYPEYVSTMAYFLEENPDYEWACCAYEGIARPGDVPVKPNPAFKPDDPHMLENFLFRRIEPVGCTYLYRRSYLSRCRVVENFCTEPRAVQETSIIIPMAAGKGKLKYFSQPLYLYRKFVTAGQGRQASPENIMAYCEEYQLLEYMAVKRLDLSNMEKDRLFSFLRLSWWKLLYVHLVNDFEFWREIAEGTAEAVNLYFAPPRAITAEHVMRPGLGLFFRALENLLLGGESLRQTRGVRVIGYGALGKRAARILPLLKGAGLEPDLLWDVGAEKCSTAADMPVSPPEFNALTSDDTLLVFPLARSVLDEVEEKLEDSKRPLILFGDEIMGGWLADCLGLNGERRMKNETKSMQG